MDEVSLSTLTKTERERLLKLALSSKLDRKTSILPSIVRVEDREHQRLSSAQQRLWFLAQIKGGSKAYHIPFGVHLTGKLDGGALRRALDRIVARHEALRTTFVMVDGEPLQRFASEDSGFHLVEYDLRGCDDAKAELDRLVVQEFCTSFDFEAGPLIRGRLIQQSDDEHLLLITMHHIVSDGWSMGVLFNELSALYEAFLRGRDDPLPKLAVQYADYAVWQRQWINGEILRQQSDYWRETLAGVLPLLDLPADHPRPPEQDYAGACCRLQLGEKLTASLKDLSRRHGTTLHMTLLAGWVTLLARLSGQHDIVVGTPVANRGRVEIENLIGFFVNMLAIRVDLSGSPTVSGLLAQVKSRSLAAQQNQDVPFEQIVEIMRPARSPSYSPLFQVMFAWQNVPGDNLVVPSLKTEPLVSAPYPSVAKYDLALSLQEAARKIVGGLEYATSLFEEQTIERYLGYFRTLLTSMAADDTKPIDRLVMLPAREREQTLHGWNDTATEPPNTKFVHEMIEEQVERTPEAVAVMFENHKLTYRELNERANQVANFLIKRKIGPEHLVALAIPRSPEMIISILGILKAGAAYLPLDRKYPIDRIAFMFEDAKPVLAFSIAKLRKTLPPTSAVISLDEPETEAALAAAAKHNPINGERSASLAGDNLAYVIYTSGSTGMPKGVMVEHNALSGFINATKLQLKLGLRDTLLAITTIAFDISILELLVPLCQGAQVVIAGEEDLLDPIRISNLIKVYQVNSVQATPSHWSMIIQHCSMSLHKVRILVGGEPLSKDLARRLYYAGSEVRNLYGPTEATVWTSMHVLRDADVADAAPGIISIGRPLVNYKVYVLDANLEPVPQGVLGELYIAGIGLARGYLRQPGLTAERFLPDPFATAGARMYKTGDLGRWQADGTIEFLGRYDDQVKIRGFRVELGEVETRLAEHAGVREVVVVAREDTPGQKCLVAYYTSTELNAEGESEKAVVGAEQLRPHLLARLPEYMVPAAYVQLERMPLTASGKLDRKALPVPEGDAYAVRGYEAPQGEMEMALARIWAEVLHVERIGRNDNFFELGGHSMLATQLVSRMRPTLDQTNVVLKANLSPYHLFKAPTVRELAEFIKCMTKSDGCDALPSIISVPSDEAFPFSYQQKRWWEAECRGAVSPNVWFGMLLQSRPDISALEYSFAELHRRHAVLRTRLTIRDGGPMQETLANGRVDLQIVDISKIPKTTQRTEARRLGTEAVMRPFNYFSDSMLRGCILKFSESEYRLLVTVPHLFSDWWSNKILARDFVALYTAFSHGLPPHLPEPEIQYYDFVLWQRGWLTGKGWERMNAFYKARLSGAQKMDLPTDYPRRSVTGFRACDSSFWLSEKLSSAVFELSGIEHVTPFTVLLCCYKVLLSRWSGQDDVVVATSLSGRIHAQASNTVGFFSLRPPLRSQVSGDLTFREVLHVVKDGLMQNLANEDILPCWVEVATGSDRSMCSAQILLHDHRINYATDQLSENTNETWRLVGYELDPSLTHNLTNLMDIQLRLIFSDRRIGGTIRYAADLFKPETVERMIADLEMLIEIVTLNSTVRVSEIPLTVPSRGR